jgi:uncharacterized protein involved in outer membrane biogenesis
MSSRTKKILIVTGVITIVAFAGILALRFNINAFTPQIEAALSTALGMDVRIKGKTDISLFPGLGLSLKDVSIRSNELDVATIEKMKLELNLMALARFEIEIIQVGLYKPVISILRSAKGLLHLEQLQLTQWERLLALKRISVFQGNLVYADDASGEKIDAGDIDLDIKFNMPSGTNSADPFRKISLTGDIRCKILRINDVTVMGLVMNAKGEKGILDINPVSLNIFGGTGNGSVHVDLTGPSPHYRVIYRLNQVGIGDLLGLYARGKIPPKTIEGPINLSADLTAMGKIADEVKRSLSGDLSLNGENLMLYNMDIDALIMKNERSQNFNLVDLAAFLLAGPVGPVLTKSYNFARLYEESQGGKGVVRKLVSVWKVENGIAEARDVALASKKQRIAMTGELNFINERFVDVTVAALDKRGCAVYSEKVHGPFRDPQIDKESIFESIAGSVMNPLKNGWDFLQGEECTVFYTGSVAQPEG